jgi:hypothetical protein
MDLPTYRRTLLAAAMVLVTAMAPLTVSRAGSLARVDVLRP